MAGINVTLAIMSVAAALMLITGNADIKPILTPPFNPSCIAYCNSKCQNAPNRNECLDICLPNCYPPSSEAHFSDCKINCEKSACSKFASDVDKLEGCRAFCWQNCNA